MGTVLARLPLLLTLTLALALALAARSAPPLLAADPLYLLTHGDQDAIVLGTVAALDEAFLTLDPARALAGLSMSASLEISQKAIRPALAVGDQVIASVDFSGGAFQEKWGIFQVGSAGASDTVEGAAGSGGTPDVVVGGETDGDLDTLRVLAGPYPPGDLLAVQRYLRSGGRDSDFIREGDSVYLIHPDGARELIHPLSGEPLPQQWSETPLSGQAESRSGSGWRLEYLAPAAAVLLLLVFLLRRRPQVPKDVVR